ncbi:MAG: type II secretion system F family protein [Candidatus Schekmanbacteria bacterium]|nr:type II secretion system F family protein [Candidatus Schekmanbacteria bacterium]
MHFAIFVLAAIAASLFFRQFFESEEEQKVKETLGYEKKQIRSEHLFFKLLYPFLSAFVPVVTNLRLPRWRKRVGQQLVHAGLHGEVTPDEFLAFKVVFGFVVMGLGFAFTKRLHPAILGGCFVVGFWFPNLWLSGLVTQRRKEILRQLPYFIDLLTLSVEAGLDFQIGLQRVVEKCSPGPLKDEFQTMLKEIRMGKTRAESLRALAHRIGISDITSFAAVLIQADQMGASIGVVLRAQADKMRAERFSRAEKAGAQASILVLIPLMLFILPAIFIVMFGSFGLAFFQLRGEILGGEGLSAAAF